MASTPDRYPGLDIRDEAGADSAPAHLDDLARLAAFLLDRLGLADDAELSVLLVDEETIARLHVEWMDEPGPTDVLSFPMDELREPAPGSARVSGVLGDVVVCPAFAHRQAVAAGRDTRRELRVLLTHGVLHLLGHDHADPAAERAMFARQDALVAEYESGTW